MDLIIADGGPGRIQVNSIRLVPPDDIVPDGWRTVFAPDRLPQAIADRKPGQLGRRALPVDKFHPFIQVAPVDLGIVDMYRVVIKNVT